jgi:hypothetical protein
LNDPLNCFSEYDKAAKILLDKESNVKLAKLDATIHQEASKEYAVSFFDVI